MKPAPENRRSIPNVIPFGDWTVDEMQATAKLFGVSEDAAYAAAQAPIESNLVKAGTDAPRRNPGIKGVAEAFWVPLAKQFTGIDPDEEYRRRLGVPADEMANLSLVSATSGSIAQIRAELVKVMETIRSIWEKTTPQEYARERLEAWWKNADKEYWKAKVAGRRGVVPGREKGAVFAMVLAGKTKETQAVLAGLEPYSPTGYTGSPYWADVGKLVAWLDSPTTQEPPFTVFTEGSSKLPFFQWSTVPGATCPGAGRCWTKDPEFNSRGKPVVSKTGPRGYCYSLSGWRNVVPYLRQVQNTILLRLEGKSGIIDRALRKIESEKPGSVVRLYVDGDFDSIETLDFWMHVCDRFPNLRFYGYSKSWDIMLEWDRRNNGRWPANYRLNLSNGSFYERFDTADNPDNPYQRIMARMMALACVRGRFVAVRMPKGPDSEMPKLAKDDVVQDGVKIEDPRNNPATREALERHRNAVEEEAVKQGVHPGLKRDGSLWSRPFVCPGLCGFCLGTYDGPDTPNGTHACAFDKFKGRTIVIAVH